MVQFPAEGNMSSTGHKGALFEEEGATPTLYRLVCSTISKPDLMFSSISDSPYLVHTTSDVVAAKDDPTGVAGAESILQSGL